eukprot:TCALIF_11073-PA protein Name:"Similar to DCAF11 DDB1- and CUL4-associated factor 11 (Pongo abelii)" AED:0.19 eAED:0.19 QI:0/0/0/0.66/1/1/6/0/587
MDRNESTLLASALEPVVLEHAANSAVNRGGSASPGGLATTEANHSRQRHASSSSSSSSSSPSSSVASSHQPTHNALQGILEALVGRTGGGSGSSTSDDSDSSNSGTCFWPPMKRSLTKNKHTKPNPEMVQDLEQSDFCNITRRDLALPVFGQPGYDTTPSKPRVPWLIGRREIGDFRWQGRHQHFTHGQRCHILSAFLPDRCQILDKYDQKVFCGTYSTDGQLFMSACQDQMIRIYNTQGRDFVPYRLIRARNVGWSVLDTALSPDGRHLIYSSWCDYVHQVDITQEDGPQQALPLSPDDGRFCLFSIRFSQDGRDILGGSNEGFLYLYDREAQRQSLKINGHDEDVNAVAFADSTTHILASGGDDGMCKIWDRRSLRESQPKPVGVLAGHVDGITYIDAKGDGRHIITNSKDQTIKLWDLRQFSPQSAVVDTQRAVKNQSWDYRWQRVPRHLVRGNLIKCVPDDTSVMTYRGHTVLQTLIRCRFSPVHTTGQRYIYTGCATGAVVIYDALTGQVVRELKGHKSCTRDVSWHPTNPELVSSSVSSPVNCIQIRKTNFGYVFLLMSVGQIAIPMDSRSPPTPRDAREG